MLLRRFFNNFYFNFYLIVATDTEKLQFYGLFKQGTQGDCKDNSFESPKTCKYIEWI